MKLARALHFAALLAVFSVALAFTLGLLYNSGDPLSLSSIVASLLFQVAVVGYLLFAVILLSYAIRFRRTRRGE